MSGSPIRIVVKSVEGGQCEIDLDPGTDVRAAVDDALKRLDLSPPPDAKYDMSVWDGGQYRLLDDGKTLSDENVKDGDTVWVGTEASVGAAARRGCNARTRP